MSHALTHADTRAEAEATARQHMTEVLAQKPLDRSGWCFYGRHKTHGNACVTAYPGLQFVRIIYAPTALVSYEAQR